MSQSKWRGEGWNRIKKTKNKERREKGKVRG
jgi:hypothetical protein